jgi:hypothetical protein
MYRLPHRAVTQSLQNLLRTGMDDDGPHMPYDLHPIIWGYVGEAERAERYRARELRFRFNGDIADADRELLLQGIREWISEETVSRRSTLEEQILQRLQPRLNAVFSACFQPDTADPVNLPARAWSQIVLKITSIRPEIHDHVGLPVHGPPRSIRPAQIHAASADGVHRIRLLFLPVGGPYTFVSILYIGPQRFMTFDDTRGTLLFEGWQPAQ